MSYVPACSLSLNMFSEAIQNGHEIDFTIIPILQMGKPGLREELTGPKPGSLEVAISGLEPRVVCCQKFTLLAIIVPGPLMDLFPSLPPPGCEPAYAPGTGRSLGGPQGSPSSGPYLQGGVRAAVKSIQ